MTPWTLMTLLLLLLLVMSVVSMVSVVWDRGVSTDRLLPSAEACKRLCWYNCLCKSVGWNGLTGGCEVSTTEVLSNNRPGVVTFTLEHLQKHWEFPGSGHPCAARPCVQCYMCVPVERATDHICLPIETTTEEETDDHVTAPTISTNSSTTDCIEVTCLGFLNTTQDRINSVCNVTCDQREGDNAVCDLPEGFITCSNGKASFKPCGHDTIYNQTLKRCDYPK
ncbi:uncharacterized protein [Haliotis asinina]|uniref:uncharacterized protein n=1 Tax=Haliotis asinina TaxID=109174 RepID=UPI003531EE14